MRDHNACTTNDACVSGVCAGTSFAGACSDGNACNGVESCSSGACVAGTAPLISDGDESTIDTCDPSSGAVTHTPAGTIDPGGPTDLADSSEFLYGGGQPSQTPIGSTPLDIDIDRVSVLRGHVFDRDGNGIPGVTISILNHPELGQTRTQAPSSFGQFDMAVTGGGQLTVKYDLAGHIPVQRTLHVPWKDYAWLPDVVMTPLDAEMTPITLGGSSSAMQVARGSVQVDTDGPRRATVLFPGSLHASKIKDGMSTGLGSLSVRATEVTVGADGPEAMAAALPPESAYTYATEVTADEALDADEIVFDAPVFFYVDNFIGFPVGTAVPSGLYDRTTAQWVPISNGVVLSVLDTSGGIAAVDTDGDGVADDGAGLDVPLSINELQALASVYTAGSVLWRVPTVHFTLLDCNFPILPDDGTCTASEPDCTPPDPEQPDPDDTCHEQGSDIQCQKQVLGEDIPLVGVPFGLHYAGDRVRGRAEANTLNIPLLGANALVDHPSISRVDVDIEIAGERSVAAFSAADASTQQIYSFTWDRKDAYGRFPQGAQPVTVKLAYVYPAHYLPPEEVQAGFAKYGLPSGQEFTYNQTAAFRGEFSATKVWHGALGGMDQTLAGLGGWDFDIHHVYDPVKQTLYRGDGAQRGQIVPPTVSRVVTAGQVAAVAVGGDGSIYYGASSQELRRHAPDNTDTLLASNVFARGIALGADGSVYFTSDKRVLEVDSSGVVTTIGGIAGSPACNQTTVCGDDAPATTIALSNPVGIAVASNGDVLFTDQGRVRRIGTDGVLTTVAGGEPNSASCTGDCGTAGCSDPTALENCLPNPDSLAFDPSGALIVGSSSASPIGIIHRITPDGISHRLAGGGQASDADDGTQATLTSLLRGQGVSTRSDGTVVFTDYDRVREVQTSGFLATLEGKHTGPCYNSNNDCGMGGPALAANFVAPTVTAVGPDGSVYVGGRDGVYRIHSPFVRFVAHAAGDVLIPSEDGSEVYEFDPAGRHMLTVDALTGAAKWTFGYEGGDTGRLSSITDVAGLVTTINYANGTIVGPFGDTTSFATVVGADPSHHHLHTLTNPAGETYTMTYDGGGLLQTFQDPLGAALGKTHTFSYAPSTGRLTQDVDSESHAQTLAQQVSDPSDVNVIRTTAEAVSTTYTIDNQASGVESRTTVLPGVSTSATQTRATDGSKLAVLPDGTTINESLIPDPRFGLLAATTSRATHLPSGHTRVETIERKCGVLPNPCDPATVSGDCAGAPLHIVRTVNGDCADTVYDPGTRSLTTTSAESRTSFTSFDTAGRLAAAGAAGFGSTSFGYTTLGQLGATTQMPTDASGNRTTSRAYYALSAGAGYAGQPHTLTDALGQVTTLDAYDAATRPTHVTLPGTRAIASAYDANGNLAALTPPPVTPFYGSASLLHALHALTYDSLDQLTQYQIKDASSGTTQETLGWGRDGDHLLTSFSPPSGAVTFTNTHDRPDTMTLPDGRSVHWFYDAATGRLASATGLDGVTITFGYDGSIPTNIAWSGAITASISRVLDDKFQVTSETAAGETVAFGYDADGLLAAAGGVTFTRYAGSTLLESVSDSIAVETYTPNGFGDTADYLAKVGSTTVFSEHYDRDALGRMSGRSETIADGEGGFDADAVTYSYDDAGRLAHVTRGTDDIEYDYDANGNRLRRHVTGADPSDELGEYDVQDRVLSYGTLSFGYGANGEVTSVTDSNPATAGTTYYTYDALGNLREVTLPSGMVIDYLIDAQNRRVGKKVNGVLTRGWVYEDQLRIAAELVYDASGSTVTLVKRFIYGSKPNVPDAMVLSSGQRYRLLSDHLGSVRVIMDSAGVVVERVDYDEYGRRSVVFAGGGAEDAQAFSVPFGFAGGTMDATTGLVRFGARDYDPRAGRWMNKDPLLLGGGDTNLYVYAGNDPINGADPTGEDPLTKGRLCRAMQKWVPGLNCDSPDTGGASMPPGGGDEPPESGERPIKPKQPEPIGVCEVPPPPSGEWEKCRLLPYSVGSWWCTYTCPSGNLPRFLNWRGKNVCKPFVWQRIIHY